MTEYNIKLKEKGSKSHACKMVYNHVLGLLHEVKEYKMKKCDSFDWNYLEQVETQLEVLHSINVRWVKAFNVQHDGKMHVDLKDADKDLRFVPGMYKNKFMKEGTDDNNRRYI